MGIRPAAATRAAIVGFFALVLSNDGALADKRVALVIGNSAYRHAPALINTVNDAAMMAETFTKAGFSVIDARDNLSATDMRRALRDFGAKTRDADIAVIYYAGHGVEIDGNNYLVPTDALLENDSDVFDETIGLDRVLVAIEPAKRLRLVILDACRDNPFARNMKRTMASRSMGRGLAKIEPSSPNTLVAFAAKAGFTALDGDGKNSPFAIALAHHLARPGLDLRKAFGYVRDEVLKATNNKQEPFIYGSLGGDDVVLTPLPPAPSPPALAVADPNAAVRQDYQFAERVGTREAWDLFIATYPAGFYTDLAKAQRNKLAAGAALPVLKTTSADGATATPDIAPATKDFRESPKPVIVANASPAGPPPSVASPVSASGTGRPKSETAAPAAQSCSLAAKPEFVGVPIGGPLVPIAIKADLDGTREVRAVAISPTGQEIATAGDDGLIRLWDAGSFKLIRTLRGHTGPVYSLDYWKDGTLLASAGWDGRVKVWEVASGNAGHVFEAAPAGTIRSASVKQFGVAFYPQEPLKYLASAGEDGYVRIWDWQKKQLASLRLDHKDQDTNRQGVRSLSYSPSGSGEFASAGLDGKVRFHRPDGGIDTKDAYARRALHVVYSPDGSRLVSAGSEGPQSAAPIKIWNTKSRTHAPLVGHEDYAVSAAWSVDGKQIVTGGGGRDKSVRLWDAGTGRLLATFIGHQADVEAVAFYPGATRLISVSEDKTIKVWDIAAKRELLTAIGFGERDFLLYTPEGCYAGSDGADNRIAILNGTRVERLSADARKAMFSPDGFASLLAR